MHAYHPLNRYALVFAFVFPTLVTWSYFVALSDHSPAAVGVAYTVGKTLQFGFPLVWVWWVLGERPRLAWPDRRGLRLGAVFGLAVGVAAWGLYRYWLEPAGFFDGEDPTVRARVHAKVLDMGLETLGAFIALGVFYSLAHSFLEEYYWRWFVFGLLRTRWPFLPAAILSALGFSAHHVIVLGVYFGWDSPATWLFSAAVAVGGMIWGWIYERTGSLTAVWLSHLLVDAAIFSIGYDLLT